MDHTPPQHCRWWQPAAAFALVALAFGLAYTQAPLYYSNQNQYFLHGLAQAGRGQLADDWLANTADPTPIFTALVAFTARYLHEYLFHIYYLVLFGVYVWSLLGTWARISQAEPGLPQCFAFVAGLTLIHAALLRWLSCQLFEVDYPWYFQAGLAGQYLLGSMFQPSTLGVFLLLSIYLFVADRPGWAAGVAALTGVLHATYLLESAVLVAAYLLVLAREGRWREGLRSGLLALGLVTPVLPYLLSSFGGTTPETAAEARHILVHFRVPHHARIERWFDLVAGLQVLWMLLGLALAWQTRLFPVLLVSFATGALLTLTQWFLDSDTLAMLFPWRISTCLVPLATALVMGRIVSGLARLSERGIWIGSTAVLAVCVVGGIVIMEQRLGYRRNDEELPVIDFVQANLQRGQTYLVPYKLPKGPGAVGSHSSDFLLEDDESGKRIPLEMQRFRLHAGAPILVDFKAIPYRDTEVIEWRRRLDDGLRIYAALQAGRFDARQAVDRFGLTHVVTTRDQPVSTPQLEAVFEDDRYRIYRIRWHSE